MNAADDVIIIGAGPYGLSVAAHLRARGAGFRIFGTPMLNWRTKMPAGMLLKSDAYASNLSDPRGSLTLKHFAAEQGFEYADEGLPVPIENFIAYGEAFQRRFVPEVEHRQVIALERRGGGFAAQLDNGEVALARRVVVAIGISDFAYLPPVLAGIPKDFLSHSSAHADMAAWRGRSLAVIGAGSSAIDLAGLAHEHGASVKLIMRRAELKFHSRTELKRPLRDRITAPNTGIGPGWRSVFYTCAPQLFRYLPDAKRVRIVSTSHGPAGGWYMVERVVGTVPVLAGFAPEAVEVRDGLIHLRLVGADGTRQTVSAEHVIACTGYRVDLRAVGFLDPGLRAEIKAVENTPVLSGNFETSVGGLYIVGPASAYSFGPMFRFVFGAEFTAPRLARHLVASVGRRSAAYGTAFAGNVGAKEAAD